MMNTTATHSRRCGEIRFQPVGARKTKVNKNEKEMETKSGKFGSDEGRNGIEDD